MFNFGNHSTLRRNFGAAVFITFLYLITPHELEAVTTPSDKNMVTAVVSAEFWTVSRVTWTMGGIIVLSIAAALIWRYRTVARLNINLKETITEHKLAEDELARKGKYIQLLQEVTTKANESITRKRYYSFASTRCACLQNGPSDTFTWLPRTTGILWFRHPYGARKMMRGLTNFESSTGTAGKFGRREKWKKGQRFILGLKIKGG